MGTLTVTMTVRADITSDIAFTEIFEITVINCKDEALQIHTDSAHTAGLEGSVVEFRLGVSVDVVLDLPNYYIFTGSDA